MPRHLRPGQLSRVLIGGPDLPEPVCVLETDRILLEAPNWTRDGRHLVLNGDGGLWLLDVDGGNDGLDGTQGAAGADALHRVPFEGLPEINNDHVLDVDGRHVLMSAQDGGIHRGALTGGPVRRISPEDGAWHFLHGISPDGSRLAAVRMSSFEEPGRLELLPTDGIGRPDLRELPLGHLDGPEWTPDGMHLVMNAEGWDDVAGHAQLTRVPATGPGEPERLLVSQSVDWFPHVSPDGRWASYLSFPPGTLGHPEDLDVVVSVVATDAWTRPVHRYELFGGQGTLNVNSWAPDSRRFAFVAYPVG